MINCFQVLLSIAPLQLGGGVWAQRMSAAGGGYALAGSPTQLRASAQHGARRHLGQALQLESSKPAFPAPGVSVCLYSTVD